MRGFLRSFFPLAMTLYLVAGCGWNIWFFDNLTNYSSYVNRQPYNNYYRSYEVEPQYVDEIEDVSEVEEAVKDSIEYDGYTTSTYDSDNYRSY